MIPTVTEGDEAEKINQSRWEGSPGGKPSPNFFTPGQPRRITSQPSWRRSPPCGARTPKRVTRSETILLRHKRMLQTLPDAVREKIEFNPTTEQARPSWGMQTFPPSVRSLTLLRRLAFTGLVPYDLGELSKRRVRRSG